MNLAIIVGVSEYAINPIAAAKEDAERIRALLDSTGVFDKVVCLNQATDANTIRANVRALLKPDEVNSIDTLFFYFSGHGFFDPNEQEFYMLCSDYDKDRRATTSLPNMELDDLIRQLSPKLTVKVLDACNSGYHYIKSSSATSQGVFSNRLANLIVMSSSLDSQSSNALRECSFFTQLFVEAVLHTDVDGEVRYRDIQNYIADGFRKMSKQTPYFVNQCTNTEVFAKQNTSMAELKTKWYPIEVPMPVKDELQAAPDSNQPPEPLVLDSKLSKIEAAIEAEESKYIDWSVIKEAFERIRTKLTQYQLKDELVAHFYGVKLDLEKELDVFKPVSGFVEIAINQNWESNCFVTFITKPTKVSERKTDLNTMLRNTMGQHSENDYELVMRDRPYQVKSTQKLPFETIVFEVQPLGKRSLKPYFAIAALVHSRTHLIFSWALGQQVMISWDKYDIDWENLSWNTREVPFKDFIADEDLVWKAQVDALIESVRGYLLERGRT